MTHTLILNPRNRELALRGVRNAPDGYVLRLDEPNRSLEQNAMFWTLVGQVQKARPLHHGVRMTPELWRVVFMDELGAEQVFIPRLNGDGMIPAGHRSSKLSVKQMTDLIELVTAFCAREGIELREMEKVG